MKTFMHRLRPESDARRLSKKKAARRGGGAVDGWVRRIFCQSIATAMYQQV